MDGRVRFGENLLRAIARSYRNRISGGTWDAADRSTLVYRLAWAIYCGRHDKPMGERGFVPPWVADLRLAEKYGAHNLGVDFSKYLWWRRALLLNEAENRSYQFEDKK